MPTISQFYGILIRMFYNDKHNPHFHAVYGEDDAIVSIANGRIIAGSLPPRAYKLVRDWWIVHQIELEKNWERARHDRPLKKIEPLR